jgi:hypothetical protein
LAASISFIESHIFWPRGVFTMVVVAAGMYLLRVVSPATTPPRQAMHQGRSAPGPGSGQV